MRAPLGSPIPRAFVCWRAGNEIVVCGASAATWYLLLRLGLAHGPAVSDGGFICGAGPGCCGARPCTVGLPLSSVWLLFLCVVVLWFLLLVSVASVVYFFLYFILLLLFFFFYVLITCRGGRHRAKQFFSLWLAFFIPSLSYFFLARGCSYPSSLLRVFSLACFYVVYRASPSCMSFAPLSLLSICLYSGCSCFENNIAI